MAVGINYQQFNVYIRDLIQKRLYTSYVASRPLLYFLAGSQATNIDKLGDPKMAVVLGGRNLGAAQRSTLNGSINNQFRFQKAKTDAATAVVGATETPVATGFGDDNVGLAETRWNQFWSPLKIRQSRLDGAKTNLAISSIAEEVVAMGFQSQLDYAAQAVWTGTLTAAQQDQEEWPNMIGVQHTVSDGQGGQSGFLQYARTDRNAYPQLQGNVVTAAHLATDGFITTTVPNLNMIRALRTVNTGASTGANMGGIANKQSDAGTLAITTPDLWNVLAAAAEGKHRIVNANETVPGFMMEVGTKYPIICKDSTYITYDPLCPSGEFYLLTPDSWTFEVQSGSNFEITDWKAKWELEEGGGNYRWAVIRAKTRLTCQQPWLQTKVTGLTAA